MGNDRTYAKRGRKQLGRKEFECNDREKPRQKKKEDVVGSVDMIATGLQYE